MKRWSALQKNLYNIIDEQIGFQIHISKYRMDSQYGSTDLPRYWITVGKEIIFDYPKDFVNKEESGPCIVDFDGRKSYYPYQTDITRISELIREYIDTPKDELMIKCFDNDHWGLTDIFKAADKRIGKRRLEELREQSNSEAVHKIIEIRLNLKVT